MEASHRDNATWVGGGLKNTINFSMTEHLPHSLQVTYYAIGIPVSVLLIVTNAILMAAIAKAGTMGAKLNMVVCNMAVADLLLGVTLLVNIGLLQEHPELADQHHTSLCTFIGLLEILPLMASLLFLSLVHLDRFLAVCVPTMYPDMWCERRVAIFCAGIWIFTCMFGTIAYAFMPEKDPIVCDILALPRSYLLLTCIFHIFPTTIVNIILFIKINHVLKVHQRKIQVTNTLTYTNLVDDTQLAKLYFFLVIMCFVAWTPFLICVFIWFSSVSVTNIPIAARVTFLVGHLAGIKIVVYVCESTSYRSAVKKRFSCKQAQSSMHTIRGSSGVQ